MSSALPYRPEVDGLRTVAVLGVIIFHLRASALEGGFLGVDVFFVISGYLITAIILGQLRAGEFSFLNFWGRRIRRLYPALLTVVAAALLLGAFLLIRPERGELPGQALAAVFSYQNIYLWLTTGGYWSQSSENILLLHTWSLSLEEQFYVVFPFILFALHRWGRGRELPILAALTIASFALCLYATPISRNASFYLLPMRMWELLLGSLLAAYHLRRGLPKPHRAAPYLQALGLIMVICSFIWIHNSKHFPGYRPLYPCLGTLLILHYGMASGWVQRLLSLKPVVYLGKISYSLYLWHWLIIVAARYAFPQPSITLLLGLTLVCAMASYHWVERPFRYGLKRPLITIPAAATALTLCTLPILLLPKSPLMTGLGNIDTKESRRVGKHFDAEKPLRAGKAGIWVNEREEADIIVLGSSHARVWCPPLADYAKAHDLSLLSTAMSGLGMHPPEHTQLERFHAQRMEDLRQRRPKVIVVAGWWSHEIEQREGFLEALGEQLRELSKISGEVLLLGEVPGVELPEGYHHAMRKYLIAHNLSGSLEEVERRSASLAINEALRDLLRGLALPNVTFVDPAPTFLLDERHVRLFEGQQILYFDDNHLNDSGTHFGFEHVFKEHLDRSFGAAH